MFYVTGDLNIDVTTDAPALSPTGKEAQARITLSCGGQGGNVAWFLAALRQPVEIFGALGNDLAGDLYAAYLQRSHVTFAGERIDSPTGMVSVVQEAGSYHMYRQRSANADADPMKLAAFIRDAVACAGSSLFLSGYSLLNEASLSAFLAALNDRDRAVTIIALDPSSIDAMRSIGRDAILRVARTCNYLLPNAEEACWLAGESDPQSAAATLYRLTGCAVVVKLGEEGALLQNGGTAQRTPGIPVHAVDVTGAGDAFAAAFLAVLAKAGNPLIALEAGIRFSAVKVGFRGTQPPAMVPEASAFLAGV